MQGGLLSISIGYNHFMKILDHIFLTLLACAVILAACEPASNSLSSETPSSSSVSATPSEWHYENLILLDPIDTPSPNDPDLFAVYLHPSDDDWVHVRLDILAPNNTNYNISLRSSTNIAAATPSGFNDAMPDIWLHPNFQLDLSKKSGVWQGQITIPELSEVPPVIQEISNLHAIIISFPEKYLQMDVPDTWLSIILTDATSTTILDVAVQNLHSPLPVAKAPILLAFWDALPASTPSQILQRWNGAHTGPFGERHGLAHLLKHAEESHIPLALLDLKQPNTLSGLSLLNQIDHIRQLEEQGLLILPTTGLASSALSIPSAGASNITALGFGFPPSRLAYGTFPVRYLPDNDIFFASLPDQPHVFVMDSRWIIPLPYPPGENHSVQQMLEADRNGLTRDTWRRLLNTALSADDSDILVLGGSLITSPWADTAIAPKAFRDLSSHPWIDLLSLGDLRSMPAMDLSAGLPCRNLLCLQNDASIEYWLFPAENRLAFLYQLPVNEAAAAAWNMAFHLSNPSGNSDRDHLQANYREQITHLIAAAQWADAPNSIASCDIDLDSDGKPECILASDTIFATMEIDDASLVTAFHLHDSGITQWVGPTSQIAVGLSDPLFWDLNAGTRSDPAVIPGSFILDTVEPLIFQVAEINQDHIHFVSLDGSVRKDYSLDDEGLQITIETSQPLRTTLVLVLDPQQRFQPDWINLYTILSQTKDSFCWGSQSGNSVCSQWTGSPQVEIHTFKDSLDTLARPQDANAVYPAGHYLPVSLATLTFTTDQGLSIKLSSRLNALP